MKIGDNVIIRDMESPALGVVVAVSIDGNTVDVEWQTDYLIEQGIPVDQLIRQWL